MGCGEASSIQATKEGGPAAGEVSRSVRLAARARRGLEVDGRSDREGRRLSWRAGRGASWVSRRTGRLAGLDRLVGCGSVGVECILHLGCRIALLYIYIFCYKLDDEN
jgi:hypothetical protein